jgi:hypothetical protein
LASGFRLRQGKNRRVPAPKHLPARRTVTTASADSAAAEDAAASDADAAGDATAGSGCAGAGAGAGDAVVDAGAEATKIFERGTLEGELKGKRDALLRLLTRAGIVLTEEDRARIDACTDGALLGRWVENVLGAKTAAEVFS